MSKRNVIFNLVVIAAALSFVDGAFARSSCSERYAICVQRCNGFMTGDCVSSHCDPGKTQ